MILKGNNYIVARLLYMVWNFRYFTVLQKFVAGVYPSESIERELSWLPGSLQKISETFVQKLIFCCNMETVTFEEYFDDEIPIEVCISYFFL